MTTSGIGIPGIHPSTATIEAIVAAHGNRIYKLAYQLTGSTADAEDVVQDVLVKLFRGWMHLQSRANLAAWITRVATNASIDHLRSRKRRGTSVDTAILAAAPSRGSTPPWIVENEEARLKLEAALATLPPRQKAALILFDHEGLSGREVAGALGVTETAVRRYVFDARRRLRDTLRPYWRGSMK